nr:thiamine pyrophosphate-requiring protein [uncultured Roseococcus sp.]
METAPVARSAAWFALEALSELGVEYIFANLGTDHVSVIEALAEQDGTNQPHPQLLSIAHENVAIHMAAGYALATGRGQAVLVHVDVGTANAGNGLHNMFRARLPVLLLAGKSPYTHRGELPGTRDNYVHYIQDPFDIASLVRPFVKWEANLPAGLVVKQFLHRAHTVMQSDPPGPVFLSLPRETLAEPLPAERIATPPAAGPVRWRGTDPATARRIAQALLQAEKPVVLTSYLGRSAEAVAALVELSEAAGLVVAEHNPNHLNFPRDAAAHAGFDPGRAIAGADLGLLLDIDVPWLPSQATPDPATRWIQVDVDAVKKDFPLWDFPVELAVQADAGTVLRQVLEILRAEGDEKFRARVARRKATWRPRPPLSLAPGLSGAAVGAALAAVLRPEDVVVNEATRNAPEILRSLPRRLPGTYVGMLGSGLGSSGGVALGLKLAWPERRIVHIVGDGSFHFSNPDTVYWTAASFGLPILTIVLDNGGWLAVQDSVRRVYPQGAAAATGAFQSRLAAPGARRFDEVARAFGAHGEAVSALEELPAALERALAAVDGGQAALLSIQLPSIDATP